MCNRARYVQACRHQSPQILATTIQHLALSTFLFDSAVGSASVRVKHRRAARNALMARYINHSAKGGAGVCMPVWHNMIGLAT